MIENDMLKSLFAMQTTLNDHTFEKHDIKGIGEDVLDIESLTALAQLEERGTNSLTNEWLRKYLEALEDECRELREELPWKWWSKDKLNMQNIRVEIIDIFHFAISLAMTAGMTSEDLYNLYVQKNKVNLDRQNNGYSKETKNEDDNKSIV